MKSGSPARIYYDRFSKLDKAERAIWLIVRKLLFETTPGPLFAGWRRFLLRSFGATIGKRCKIEASCRIWSPKNLQMGEFACLASGVDCYNVALIRIDDYATVSQRSFLCSASHETDTLSRPLTFSPITIEAHAWICAEAFVGPGVTVGEGAIVGARSVATRNLEAWGIYAGNPALLLKRRSLKE